jgi:hypothetical protein
VFKCSTGKAQSIAYAFPYRCMWEKQATLLGAMAFLSGYANECDFIYIMRNIQPKFLYNLNSARVKQQGKVAFVPKHYDAAAYRVNRRKSPHIIHLRICWRCVVGFTLRPFLLLFLFSGHSPRDSWSRKLSVPKSCSGHIPTARNIYNY